MRVRIAGTGSRESRDLAANSALMAAIDALAAAGRRANDVGCVTVAVTGGEGRASGQASALSAQLGLTGVPAFDVHDRVSPFLYALSVSEHFVRLGTYPTALVAAVDLGCAGDARSDRAAAVLLAPGIDEERGILAMGLRHDGRFDRAGSLRGSGRHAVAAIDEALRATGIAPRDVALVIESPSLRAAGPLACRRLHLLEAAYLPDGHADRPSEEPPAVASHLPRRLDTAIRTRKVAAGDVVLLVSCGPGLTWGWAMLRC